MNMVTQNKYLHSIMKPSSQSIIIALRFLRSNYIWIEEGEFVVRDKKKSFSTYLFSFILILGLILILFHYITVWQRLRRISDGQKLFASPATMENVENPDIKKGIGRL